MKDVLLTQTALYVDLVALVLMLARVAQPRLTRWVPLGVIALGSILQIAAFGMRWSVMGWMPVTSLYEIIVCFGLALSILILLTFQRHDHPWLAAMALLAQISLLCYGLYGQDSEIRDVVPGLRSNWMVIHVSSWCVSYSAFTLGFLVSVGLLALRRLGLHAELQEKLSGLFHKLVLVGFPFHTLGLVTGALWAKSAWASPWFHDAKEWAAAITWLIFAIYLHLHRKESKGADWLGILGMASIVFAFMGVNYIPSAKASAHTYVSPGDPGVSNLVWMMLPFVILPLALWGLGFVRKGEAVTART